MVCTSGAISHYGAHHSYRETNHWNRELVRNRLVSQVITAKENEKADEAQDSYDAGKDFLYRAYLWATIIGVAAGIGVLIFIGIQTNSSTISANAAVKSAAHQEKTTYVDVFGQRHVVECGARFDGDLIAIVAEETKVQTTET
jgi:hypothetical protein